MWCCSRRKCTTILGTFLPVCQPARSADWLARLTGPPIHFAGLTYIDVPTRSAEFILCDTVTLAVTPCHLVSVCLIVL